MTEKSVPLVLIPGLLCTAALWQHQIRGLADIADCQVAGHTACSSVGATAASILENAPETFALAGLSMGGYIAFEIMRQAPARVERLALLDTRADADTPGQSSQRRDFMALAQHGKFRGVTPRLLPALVHPDHVEDPALRQIIFTMAEEVGVEGFLNQQQSIIDRPDSVADLAGIKCPVLVLCGAQDTVTPVELHRDMAARIPGAHLEIVEGAGHLSPLEQPEAVTGHMRNWLLS